MKIKPRKDSEPEDESLPYLQGTSIGSVSFVELSNKKPIRTVKKKPQIGFIRQKEKKNGRKV